MDNFPGKYHISYLLAQSLGQKKLDTMPRYFFAHFLHTCTVTHTFLFGNVKVKTAQNLQCWRFRQCLNIWLVVLYMILTFGWFGCACLSTLVLNLAILADLISTFYKVGIIGISYKLHSQHNTTNTTTIKMSRPCPTLSGFALFCHG